MTKSITVLDGHLTAGNKKAISAVLDAGLRVGKVGRTVYEISGIDSEGLCTVRISANGRGMIPCPGSSLRMMVDICSIKITN